MNLLVIRFSSAGDIVLASLFVRCLRARFPSARIRFVTKEEFAPLVSESPYLDAVTALKAGTGFAALRALKRGLSESIGGRYDIVFDLHNSVRSRYLRAGLGRECAVLRKPTVAKWLLVHRKINRLRPVVPIPERYLATGAPYGVVNDGDGLDLFIGETAPPISPDGRPMIALAPGARHATKQWPAERFAALGAALARERNARIVLLGSPSERDLCERIASEIGAAAVNLAGRTNFLEAAAVLDGCAVAVTNDSALAHIAAARKRPVVAVFGSTVQEFGFAPYGTRASVVEIEALPCRPCTTIGRDACPLGHFRCMLDITPERVAEHARRLMNI